MRKNTISTITVILLIFLFDTGLGNHISCSGITALIFSVTFGANDTINMLTDKGSGKIIRDNFRKTALDYAVTQGNDVAIKFLE
ncbi:ankyrin repeat domain-containing protein [Bacteroidetes bacterium endosymbiont of Geopemphigus sp.]|uniref:ankyrin repeat domain-containing protein n=1 Tax=Bacteroidetes bacterium endosymbiont of Geopemphigus sp. TaxID=2047937 RepID=UPI000CD2E7BB|nr:ankyrin repeat domain-containing protein [Bacteroidetes bacterium endosymbiont of Geopemphigus sp.]